MASRHDKRVADATTKLGRTIAGALRSWAKEVGADDIAGEVMDRVREGFDVVLDRAKEAAGKARTRVKSTAKKTARKASKKVRTAAKRRRLARRRPRRRLFARSDIGACLRCSARHRPASYRWSCVELPDAS